MEQLNPTPLINPGLRPGMQPLGQPNFPMGMRPILTQPAFPTEQEEKKK